MEALNNSIDTLDIWLIAAGIFVIALIIILILVARKNSRIQRFKEQAIEAVMDRLKFEAQVEILKGEIFQINTGINEQVQIATTKLFDEWKLKEWTQYKTKADEMAITVALTRLETWKGEEGDKMRKDAIKRSMAVNLGKITEHLIPFSDQFTKRDFSPQDARFIGNPVDLILFDGASPNSEKGQVTIYFIEVKTGKGVLNEGQRLVKEAVIQKRVEWLELKKGELSWETTPSDTPQ